MSPSALNTFYYLIHTKYCRSAFIEIPIFIIAHQVLRSALIEIYWRNTIYNYWRAHLFIGAPIHLLARPDIIIYTGAPRHHIGAHVNNYWRARQYTKYVYILTRACIYKIRLYIDARVYIQNTSIY